MAQLYLCVVHYPVRNTSGEIVKTSVTVMDVHDGARLAKTYGIRRLFIATPLASQKALAQRVLRYWMEGDGAERNPTRREALQVVQICGSISDAAESVERLEGTVPLIVATHAQRYGSERSFADARGLLSGSGQPILLLFGTGDGLAPSVIQSSDFSLEPIQAEAGWNHLPVRSAMSIAVDRLLGTS